VVVPKNCTMNVTLSWYVPPLANSYTLLVQKQSGMFPELDLTILPTPGDCASAGIAPLHFDGIMGEDMSFSAPHFKPTSHTGSTSCYPQPACDCSSALAPSSLDTPAPTSPTLAWTG